MPGAGDLMTYDPPISGSFSVRRVTSRPGDAKETMRVIEGLKEETEEQRAFFPPLVYVYSGQECVFQPSSMWWKKDTEFTQMGWKMGRNGEYATRLVEGIAHQIPLMRERSIWVPDLERTKRDGPPPSSMRSRMCSKGELNWLSKYGPIQAEVPLAGGLIAYPLTATRKDGKPLVVSIAQAQRESIEQQQKAVQRYLEEKEKMEAKAELELERHRSAVEAQLKAKMDAMESEAEMRFKRMAAEMSEKYDMDKILAPAKKQKQA